MLCGGEIQLVNCCPLSMLLHAFTLALISNSINIQHINISLPGSIDMSPGVLLAGQIHYWVAWLVATQYSPLAKQKKAIGLSEDSSKVGF